MKRKILVTLLAFCLIASLCVVGAAASGEECDGGTGCDHEAAIGYVHYDTLADALSAAVDGNTVMLLRDAESDATVKIQKDITLDLGGNTFTSTVNGAAISVDAGTSFTLQNGILNNVNTSSDKAGGIFVETNGTLTVARDATIIAVGCGVKGSATDNSGNVTINIYGTIDSGDVGVWGRGPNNVINIDGAAIYSNYFGVYQNGSYGGCTYTIRNSTVVDTYGNGVYISNSLKNSNDQSQGLQTLIIKNSSITGPTAVEAKYTNVTISGENTVLTATGDPPDQTLNNNGSVSTGYALAITHNGTTTTADSAGGDISVASGTFVGLTGVQSPMGNAEPTVEMTITGGSFSNSVAEYVADGLKYEANSDGVFTYHRTIESAVAAAGNGGSVSMISNGAAVGPDDEGVHTITRIDGGSETTMTVTYGYVYTLPELDKNGYTFVGWRLGNSNTILKPGDTYTVNSDVTFTAVWNMIMIPDTYDIAVDQPAHGTVDVSFSNASQGSVITVTATPDEGYELVYITVDGEPISGNSFVMPDHAVEVSALFAEIGKEVNFVDVSRADWFYDYVQYVAQNGLMEGTTRTAFEPNASMTRAMFWTVLARIDGETITGDAWKTLAQTWAVESGISDGTNADALITREQMVTMLYRFANSPEVAATGFGQFTDGASVSDYATDAVTWALSEGILTGMGDGILAPQGTATRAQAAAMLMRFVEA